MPSTKRKQKAWKTRSRQSDVTSDIENMDVMLGNFPEDDFERQEIAGELEADLESDRLHSETSQAGENFRSRWNTNAKVNSEITAKTSRAIYSEPFGGKLSCPKKKSRNAGKN